MIAQIRMDSLEERVSEFLQQDLLIHESSANLVDDFDQKPYYGSGKNNFCDERELYWESQEALLQELLERYSMTGSKLREEISRIIGIAKETEFCNCLELKPNSNGCISCLRQMVVSFLCKKGFEARLCNSRWKHTNKYPGGAHEYIEVIANTVGRKKQIPYLIELELKDQFEMAKACDAYRKLVDRLPEYYIGKADYLNAIVGVLCDSAKRSMKDRKIYMGPWRKRSFMQMKWSKHSFQQNSSTTVSISSANQYQSKPLHLHHTVAAVTCT